MIVNHKYKFLFVHIHKTAGSSIRNSLLRYVPESYFLGYDHSFIDVIPDPSIYKDYFKFCIVRNPYERLVSWYYSILNLRANNTLKTYITNNSINFSTFLDCTDIVYETQHYSRYNKVIINNPLLENAPNLPYPKSLSFNQLDYISRDQQLAVDYIGRFENLNLSWKHICDTLNIDVPLSNDKVGNWRKEACSTYRDFYRSEDIIKAQKLYHKDINYFNYDF